MKHADNKSTINSLLKDIVKILAIIKKNALKVLKYLKVIQKRKTKYFSTENVSDNGNYYFHSIIGSHEIYHT